MKTLVALILLLATNNCLANCSTLENKIYVPCGDYQGEKTLKAAFPISDPGNLIKQYKLTANDFDEAYFNQNKKILVVNKIHHLLFVPKKQIDSVLISTENGKISVEAESLVKIDEINIIFLILLIIAIFLNSSLTLSSLTSKDSRLTLHRNLKPVELKKIWLTSPLISSIGLSIIIGFATNTSIALFVGGLTGIINSVFGYRLVNKPVDLQSAFKASLCGGFTAGFMGFLATRIFEETGLFSILFLEFLLIWFILISFDILITKIMLQQENSY